MDTTKLNETKAKLNERTQLNGQRAFVVTLPGLNCVFSKKSAAKEFKRLYDESTKHAL